MSEWQPIETAPKYEFCIVAIPFGKKTYVTIGRFLLEDDDNGYWFGENDMRLDDPTHWMPLPAPPVVEGEE